MLLQDPLRLRNSNNTKLRLTFLLKIERLRHYICNVTPKDNTPLSDVITRHLHAFRVQIHSQPGEPLASAIYIRDKFNHASIRPLKYDPIKSLANK